MSKELNWKDAAIAWANGKCVQFPGPECWLEKKASLNAVSFHRHTTYRIKPEPKKTPWTFEDVPKRPFMIKNLNTGVYHNIDRITPESIYYGSIACVNYDNMIGYFAGTFDGETWFNCWNEEE